MNLRNDYNPAPFDRTHVFNAHYLIDFGKRYHGRPPPDLGGSPTDGRSPASRQLQSGVDLPSAQGENFGFGYGSLQVAQVYTVQQAQSTSIQPRLHERSTTSRRIRTGNQYCVNEPEPDGLAGHAGLSADADLNCNPAGGSKQRTSTSIRPASAFRCLAARRPERMRSRPTPRARVCTGCRTSTDRRTRTTIFRCYKNFAPGENKNVAAPRCGVQLPQSPAGLVQQQRQHEPDLGNLNYAVAGQPLTPTQLADRTFGIANIKYGPGWSSWERSSRSEAWWPPAVSAGDIADAGQTEQTDAARLGGPNAGLDSDFGGVLWPASLAANLRRLARAGLVMALGMFSLSGAARAQKELVSTGSMIPLPLNLPATSSPARSTRSSMRRTATR